MSASADDSLFNLISDLVLKHSPSGFESEIDDYLLASFRACGHEPWIDAAGNVIVKVPGAGKGSLAITAHKDEIGASVTHVRGDGVLKVRNLGGSFPWIYGEGVVDFLGDRETISGVLSFGSRHVSHASPQHVHKADAPLKWADAWVETLHSPAELAASGIRVGTPMVVGRHRKSPFRMGRHIASYALDNKASLAVLLELANTVRSPPSDIYLIATSREEVGAVGAMFAAKSQAFDALLSLEIAPMAPEYSIEDSDAPVVLVEDAIGPYDDRLIQVIRACAAESAAPVQLAAVNGFGSDGSYTMKAGYVPRAACIGFATRNTHGFEIASLSAIRNCGKLVEALCRRPIVERDEP